MSYNFSPLEELMHDFTEHREIPGADIIVALDGKPVYRYFTGYADGKPVVRSMKTHFIFCFLPLNPLPALRRSVLSREGYLT